uniref:MICOS complex subunit MIC10 n=1 Tax=Lygus hesperus TaxID=30085 RepID=A0A0A9Y6L7_LYGHE
MDCNTCAPLCMPEEHMSMFMGYCVKDHFWKTTAGILSGWFVAKLLTKPSRFTCKKKTWPIIMGLGMGLGLASEYCKREFGHALSDKRRKRRRHRRKQHLNWSEPCK